MKKRIRRIKILAAALAVLLLALVPTTAFAATGIKAKEPSRAISIVFDNSGSMYTNGLIPLMRWCQATYAMEVFAAMLNKGDVLRIHPMHEIEVDANKYTMDDPLVINGADDAGKIRRIFSPKPGATPIEAVTAAYDALQGVSADERWLIVLTDGTEFYRNNIELSRMNTKQTLTEMLTEYNNSVNVMYLGIDVSSDADAPEIRGSMRNMTKTALSADVPAVLSAMSNFIFQRDEIPNRPQFKTDHSLNFDIPMKKLIILVQGENVSNVRLTDAAGRSPAADRSYALKYSERGTQNRAFGVDKSLQGMMVTFSDVAAGNYTLDYSGASSSVSAYYEPSVDLAVMLCDKDGRPIGENEELFAGEYQIAYGLLDSNGQFTDSELLGDTQYTIDYELNGVAQTPIQAKGTGAFPLKLGVDESVKAIHATVHYLITPSHPQGYLMEKNGLELGWNEAGYRTVPHPAGTLQIQYSGGRDSYQLQTMEKDGVYRLVLTYEGEQLTGKALRDAQIQAEVQGPGKLIARLDRENDAYVLRLKHSGKDADTAMGDYRINITAAVANVDGQVANTAGAIRFSLDNPEHSFEMQLERPQGYYIISKISDGQPLIARFTMDGALLTDEQLAGIRFAADGNGLPLETEMVPGSSAWRIRIAPEGELKSGIYTVLANSELKDEIGRALTADGRASVELQPYPAWARTAVVCLLALLLLTLIFLYLNSKILPKSIATGNTLFSVDGSQVPGSAICELRGGKKKRGSLTLKLPRYSPNPLLHAGFTMQLMAISPRRVKSSARRAKVLTGVAPNNTAAITSIKIGSTTFVKDSDGKKFIKSGGKSSGPVEFEIGNGIKCIITGEVPDENGSGTSFSMSTTLRFR